MADVIRYEEGDPDTLNAFQAGYPRFFRNPLITRLAGFLEQEEGLPPGSPLVPSREVAADFAAFLGLPESALIPLEGFWAVRLPDNDAARLDARAFLQHTGSGVSSREAETVLAARFGHSAFPESRSPEPAIACDVRIREHLHGIYGTAAADDIRLYRGGMNAFYAGFRAVQAVQAVRDRHLWIQLGWLYVDTIRVLERFSRPADPPVQVLNVLDLDDLKAVLADHGHRVAGIVTEVPTNPLVQTPDLGRLRELADKYRAALVLDPTLVSPHNVNVLEFSDLHINSLTKYAATEADVMMGALALNHRSRFYDDLRLALEPYGATPSGEDLARMAVQIDGYAGAIRRMNRSTVKVAEFLESHPAVHSVHWAGKQPSAWNYNWIQHREAGPGAIVSFSVHQPVESFYDRCALVKSPSFGARFTMMCPFMYLAHYDLVRQTEGRAFLQSQGIDPGLIRLSVGLEDPAEIIAALDDALA
jgi:cystathionine gamma-synthase